MYSSQIFNAFNYARAFSAIRHQFVIALLVPKHEKKHYEALLAQFQEIQRPNVLFSPIFLKSRDESLRSLLNLQTVLHDFGAVVRTIRAQRPDVVIGMYVIHAYPLVLLKRFLGFSLFTIASGGDLQDREHNSLFWRIIRRAVYSNSRVTFTVGDRLKAQVDRESGRESSVIPTGTDPDYYRPVTSDTNLRKKYGFRPDDFLVLTLSLLVRQKCIDDVIRAINQLRNKYPNVKMIVAGDGPDRPRLVQMCQDLGVSGDILFTGYVYSDATKRDLFNIADVYVMASCQEGMPFSLMEAMSCGCVCVCSNVGDVSNLVQDSVNGFLITPRDPQLLASRIEETMSRSEQELSQIRSRARQTILKRHDFRRLTEEMLKIIERNMSLDYRARGQDDTAYGRTGFGQGRSPQGCKYRDTDD